MSDEAEIAAGSDPLNSNSRPEICDGSDNDLDGTTDEGFTNTDGDNQADCVDLDDDNDGQSDAGEIECGSDPLDASAKSPDIDNDNIPDCIDLVRAPSRIGDCQNGGWGLRTRHDGSGFRNQGDCIQYVNTGG